MKTFNSFIQIKIFIIWIYCLSCFSTIHGQTSCPNLVQNGDFESTGSFTSGLNPDCRCTANSYCVSNDFNNKCTQWPNFGDHTPTGTKFLIIDGSTGGAVDVWRSTINVVPGTPYTFSFYIATFYSRANQSFDIGMIVNGQVEHQFTYSQATTTPAWVKISYSGITPTGITSLPIAIRQMTGGAFRDFGIDDIYFGSCDCKAYVGLIQLTSCFSYQFFDNSYGFGPFTYSWNFGDPNSGVKNISNLQNPSHQFSGCGSYNICLTITGPNGCKNTSCQILNFVDTQKPTITCPANLSISCNSSTLPNVTGMATATDNCMNTFALGITYTDVAAIRPPCDHSIIRNWVATDVCGNSASCIQTIRLVDTTKPTIYCPQNRTIQCNVNNPPSLGLATATDNCTPTSNIILSHTDVLSGTAPCNLTITRTWTAEDACKNIASCVQIAKMADTVPPTISCPRFPTVNTNPGQCYFTGIYPSASANDSCDSNPIIICSLLTPSSSILITPNTQYPKGVNNITCYAVDICGNRSQNCEFKLTVVDNEKPKIICPQSVSVIGAFDTSGQCTAKVNGLAPKISDNCPMATATYTLSGATMGTGVNDASGTSFKEGLTTVKYIVTDMAGNKDSCSLSVNVICKIKPNPCDSIHVGVQLLEASDNDTFMYQFYYSNFSEYNFSHFEIKVDSGEIDNIEISSAYHDSGWVLVDNRFTQSISLTPQNWEISKGFEIPLTIILVGNNNHKFIIKTFYHEENGQLAYCTKAIVFSKLPGNVNCCPSGFSEGPELVQHGDFEPGYSYTGFIPNPQCYFGFIPGGSTSNGSYSILTGTQVFQANQYWACIDHSPLTSPSGHFLVVDGQSSLQLCGNIWEQQILVTPNKNYVFKAYLNNLVIPLKNWDDAIVYAYINNNPIPIATSVTQGNLGENPDTWIELKGTWYSNVSGSVTLKLRMATNSNTLGSDVAVDDISFRECIPFDTCCVDSIAFVNLVNQGFTINKTNCKVIVTAPQFDSCYQFSSPPVLDGGIAPQVITNTNGMWMYNFIQSGVHQVCVTVFDDCNTKQMCTRFEVKCDTCYCGSFSNLSARTSIGLANRIINCNDTLPLNCPQVFQFGGEFACQGNDCDSTTKVEWSINGPIGGGGTVLANPGFTLPLNAHSFSINGLYTLTLTGYCNGKPCTPCIIYFEVTGCSPCCKDSTSFSNAVANFQTNGALGNCIIYENGIGLDSCMQVTWNWGDGNTTGPVGNATQVSHVYLGTGTYNVCYNIEEIDANGKVCHTYTKCDSIYMICDTCECAGADHLSFGGHDFSTDAVCSSTKIIDLPCDANGQPFYFHGNLHCTGDSCLEGKFEWTIRDTTSKIINGFGPIHMMNASTGHFDIINLNAALFTPGVVYTITVTWYCGGKKCTCDIKFRFKDCDCKCGEFTNVFLRPTHGAPSIPVKCDGDAKQVVCPSPGQPFNISGQFHCMGKECPTNTQIDWILLDPSGNKVDSGTFISTPNWSLNLNNHHFGKAGTYTLMLTGHCGSKLCPCKIKFTFKEACPCDDCNCGKYSDMFIRSGQEPLQAVSLSNESSQDSTRYIFYESCEKCNSACPGVCFMQSGGEYCRCYFDHLEPDRTQSGTVISCPPNGQGVVVTGKLACEGKDCRFTTMLDWVLLNPNGIPIASGNAIASPSFSVNISPLLLTDTNDYTLQLTGHCGAKLCPGELKFRMEAPCPDKCECDKFSILSAISHGPAVSKNCGDSIYVQEGLKLFFSATFNCKGICPPYPPLVFWSLTGPKGFTPLGGNTNATPNINISIDEANFTLPGVYTLTMIGHCGNKECNCKIYFVKSNDCCKDEQIFEQDVLNNITITSDPITCKVTLNTGNLSECSCISKISWGDGSQTFGPIMVGGMSMHTYAANGTYILSYIVSETDPATGEYCNVNVFKDTVKIQCGPKLGFEPIIRNDFDTKIRVFPNPNTGSFIVDLISPALPGTKLRVVGLTGQLLAEKIADHHKSTQTMNVQTLPSGLYFIQILVEGKLIKVEKFIKQ